MASTSLVLSALFCAHRLRSGFWRMRNNSFLLSSSLAGVLELQSSFRLSL